MKTILKPQWQYSSVHEYDSKVVYLWEREPASGATVYTLTYAPNQGPPPVNSRNYTAAELLDATGIDVDARNNYKGR